MGSKMCIVRAEFITPLIFGPGRIRLHEAFNHPSDKVLSTLLVSPSAINIKITPIDFQNARAIYGPCPHCLECKSQPSKGSYKSFDDALKPTQPGELLHCDIVFIIGKPRLFVVDHVRLYVVEAAIMQHDSTI